MASVRYAAEDMDELENGKSSSQFAIATLDVQDVHVILVFPDGSLEAGSEEQRQQLYWPSKLRSFRRSRRQHCVGLAGTLRRNKVYRSAGAACIFPSHEIRSATCAGQWGVGLEGMPAFRRYHCERVCLDWLFANLDGSLALLSEPCFHLQQTFRAVRN